MGSLGPQIIHLGWAIVKFKHLSMTHMDSPPWPLCPTFHNTILCVLLSSLSFFIIPLYPPHGFIIIP